MEEFTADIAFDGFVDMPEFYGEGRASYRLAMVKRREDFLDLFADAAHVDAVTYGQSPSLMVQMLREYGVGSLDVLVGNADDFEDEVNEVATAKELVELHKDNRLTIRLKNQKIVHAKLYRIVTSDDRVKLVHGSANLSNNSWDNHTNQIAVFETEVGTELDDTFRSFLKEFHDSYGHRTLLDDFVSALEDADTEAEREERIEYWVGAGDLDVSNLGALNRDATDDITDVADTVNTVVSDPEEADQTVAFVDEPEHAGRTVVEPTQESASDEPDNPSTDTNTDDTGDAERRGDDLDRRSNDGDPDVGLVESGQETELTDTLDRPRARVPDETVHIGTSRADDDATDDFGSRLREHGATVEDHSIRAPIEAYTAAVRETTSIPVMSVDPEVKQAVLGDDDEVVLVATNEPTPEALDHCLETLEAYVETVEQYGHTNNTTPVMAQMYEAFLYGFWAPFANQYAEALSTPSTTLENVLQHLYIEGKSDAGKDKLTEYILRLISDGTVTAGVDADEIGVREIRGIRKWDTCFPYAIIDVEKQKVESWSPIRNYWGDWTPTSVDQPCLIFTTNDTLPRSEFRNRMKVLSMDVAFPSNPEDPQFHEAQEALTDVFERRNPIFSYVAHRMLNKRPWTDGRGTVEDVRRIVGEFYDEAGRPMPDYFPADEPAEKQFDTGRLKWQKDINGGRVTFEREPEGIRAEFDREGWEVHDYEKRLDKRFITDKSGQSVYIGAPEMFAEWVGYTTEELLADPDEDGKEAGVVSLDTDRDDSDEDSEASKELSDGKSEGFLSRLF
jgi:hypothetical protein